MTWSDQQRERWLAGLYRLGVEPAAFVAWCEATGRPHPETWDERRRYRALVWLSEAANRARVATGRAAPADPPPPPPGAPGR